MNIIKLFYEIKKSKYIMQIITLMSGTLIAQLIMFISIPILTRLYTPTEFGLYSTFTAVITIIGSISSLKYDQAIMLPKLDKDAEALLFLSTILTIVMTIISIVIVMIFYNYILSYFHGYEFIVYLIPIGIFLIGIIQILNAYSSRNQLYKSMSIVRILNSSAIATIQISSKYYFYYNGLIIAKLIAEFISILLLLRVHFRKQTLQLVNVSKRRILINSKRYENFPKYQTTTVFISSLAQNLPILLLGTLFSPEVAGFYALTTRVLNAPIGLIGKSTREVYYQKASKMYARGEDFSSLYIKTTLGLLKLFIIPFFTILFFGEEIFEMFFDEKWKVSGLYAEILIFWFLTLFIKSPSVASFSILNLQKSQMILSFVSIFLRVASFYIGFYVFNSEIHTIQLYAFVAILINLFSFIYIYLKLKKQSTREP